MDAAIATRGPGEGPRANVSRDTSWPGAHSGSYTPLSMHSGLGCASGQTQAEILHPHSCKIGATWACGARSTASVQMWDADHSGVELAEWISFFQTMDHGQKVFLEARMHMPIVFI